MKETDSNLLEAIVSVVEGRFGEPFAGWVGEREHLSNHTAIQYAHVKAGIAKKTEPGHFDETGQGHGSFNGYRLQKHVERYTGAERHAVLCNKMHTTIANLRSHRGGALHVEVLHPGQTATGNFVKTSGIEEAAKGAIEYHKDHIMPTMTPGSNALSNSHWFAARHHLNQHFTKLAAGKPSDHFEQAQNHHNAMIANGGSANFSEMEQQSRNVAGYQK